MVKIIPDDSSESVNIPPVKIPKESLQLSNKLQFNVKVLKKCTSVDEGEFDY